MARRVAPQVSPIKGVCLPVTLHSYRDARSPGAPHLDSSKRVTFAKTEQNPTEQVRNRQEFRYEAKLSISERNLLECHISRYSTPLLSRRLANGCFPLFERPQHDDVPDRRPRHSVPATRFDPTTCACVSVVRVANPSSGGRRGSHRCIFLCRNRAHGESPPCGTRVSGRASENPCSAGKPEPQSC